MAKGQVAYAAGMPSDGVRDFALLDVADFDQVIGCTSCQQIAIEVHAHNPVVVVRLPATKLVARMIEELNRASVQANSDARCSACDPQWVWKFNSARNSP